MQVGIIVALSVIASCAVAMVVVAQTTYTHIRILLELKLGQYSAGQGKGRNTPSTQTLFLLFFVASSSPFFNVTTRVGRWLWALPRGFFFIIGLVVGCGVGIENRRPFFFFFFLSVFCPVSFFFSCSAAVCHVFLLRATEGGVMGGR